MIEIFAASTATRLFITFILGLCFLFQTLAIVLNFYRHDRTTRRIIENLFEIAILSQIFIFSLLHGTVVNGFRNGIVVPIGYENIRITIFIIILTFAIGVCFLNRSLLPLIVIAASLITVPAIENIIGSLFPEIFVITLIFFLARSITICRSSLIAIRTSISAFSIIDAVDTLHTGVLFSEQDGYTVLSNHQMQRLMLLLTGKVFRNSVEFYEMLLSDKYNSRYEKVEIEGQSVYILPDGTAWMFTKTEITLPIKRYIHISATEVTENWALTTKLKHQEEELRKKSNELKKAISNLHILSKEKEIDNAKMRAHDILGQRLTVLLRMIQSQEDLDYELLISLSKGILAELKAEHDERSAFGELRSIQQIFAPIGVDINFKGQLPDNEVQASLLVDIIREGTANAVRHGFATQVNIEAEETEDLYNMLITNNGHTVMNPIMPGSGIRVMMKKIESQGGNLEITHYPQFKLAIVLPGGGNLE